MTATARLLWIAANMWGRTTVVVTSGQEVEAAGTFSAPAGAPVELDDLVERVMRFVEQHLDTVVTVYLAEAGAGASVLARSLAEICKPVVLGDDAPALATLNELVERAHTEQKARTLVSAPPLPPIQVGPGGLPLGAGMPAPAGAAPAAPLAEYVPLAGRGLVPGSQGGIVETPDAGAPEVGVQVTRLDAPSPRAPTVLNLGTKVAGKGGGAPRHDVIDAGAPLHRGPPPPVKGPPIPVEAMGGGLGAEPTLPTPAYQRGTGGAFTPASASPPLSPEALALAAAVRAVAGAHPDEVAAACGTDAVDTVDFAKLLLWAMTHGRVGEVLGASPALAGAHLRAAATGHRDAILAETGAAVWGEVSVEEIALWMAERLGELPEGSKAALTTYRAAIRKKT